MAAGAPPPAPRASQTSSSGKTDGKGGGKTKKSGTHPAKKKGVVTNEEFEANPLADEDGCVGQLFHYLWRRNSLGQTCPGINIPDTVRVGVRGRRV